mgnify:CR=1 FL=1
MIYKEMMTSLYRIQTMATIFGLTALIFGCTIPTQMPTASPSSTGSEIPKVQESDIPSTTDPNTSGADLSDVSGESAEDPRDDSSNIPGTNSEASSENMDPAVNADSELDQSLSEFDDLFEGGTYSSNIDILIPPGTDAATTSSDEPLFEELDSNAAIVEASEASPESAPGQIDESNQREDEGTITETSDPQPIPDDIGDGRGDNVIERQIRQAAELETDPILKEQLWDEYRRMKGQKE